MKHLKTISRTPTAADVWDIVDLQFLIDLLTILAAVMGVKKPTEEDGGTD